MSDDEDEDDDDDDDNREKERERERERERRDWMTTTTMMTKTQQSMMTTMITIIFGSGYGDCVLSRLSLYHLSREYFFLPVKISIHRN